MRDVVRRQMKVYVVYTEICEWNDFAEPEPEWEFVNVFIEGVRSTEALAEELVVAVQDRYRDSGFKIDLEARTYYVERVLK